MTGRTTIGFKVWYADGSKHACRTAADAERIPDDGVVFMTLYFAEATEANHDQKYRHHAQGSDFYFVQDVNGQVLLGQDNQNGRSPTEMGLEILSRYPGAVVLRGKWMDTDGYLRIVERAMADHDYSEF